MDFPPPSPVDEPVGSEILRIKEVLIPRYRSIIQEQVLENFTKSGELELLHKMGGFDAFMKTSPGKQMEMVIDLAAGTGAVIHWLETEHKRRSEWEATERSSRRAFESWVETQLGAELPGRP